MSAIQNLRLSFKKLGLRGTFRLLAEKRAKRKRLQALLTSDSGFAELVSPKDIPLEISEKEHITIIERADEMLRDENYVFTFIHHLKGIPDPWNYDPIEKNTGKKSVTKKRGFTQQILLAM